MLKGSGISTYLMGLIRQYQTNYSHYKLNYLVREYTRVISAAPDYQLQHSYPSKIYSISEQLFYPSILRKKIF